MMSENFKTDKLVSAFAVILLFTAEGSYSFQLTLSSNYILNYELINGNSFIDFKIQAINVTGWLGIGLNPGNATMDGSDLFIGGLFKNGSEYGKDYHVPSGSGNNRPTVDTVQNWKLLNATELNGTTLLHVRRPLETGDVTEDVIIENKNLSLLWSYNANCDNVNEKHTSRGGLSVNLVATGGGEATITTSQTNPPTETLQTNPTTSSGASVVDTKFSMLIFCVLTSSIWI